MKLKKWTAVLLTMCLAGQSVGVMAEGIQEAEPSPQISINQETEPPAAEETPAPIETDMSREEEPAQEKAEADPEKESVLEEMPAPVTEPQEEQNTAMTLAGQEALPETFDYVDPQFITDEKFFGEYDSANDTWIQPGYFDYEKYPQLEGVQNAAKEGNYPLAKALITEYYREKAKTYNIAKSGSATKANILIANMGVENMYANELSGATIIDIVKFQNTPSYTEVDVASNVTSALASGKKLSLKLVGLRKDGSAVEISAKESGQNVPVLEIASKGVITKIEPSKDTYISSGANKGKNYGTEPVIKICESASSIGTVAATDENTARGWIQFDLDDLNAGDTIANATLKLYGSNVGAGEFSEIVIFSTTNTSWGETNMNWNSYKHYIYSYYGEEGLNYVNRPSDASNRYLEDILRFEHGPRRMFSMYHHTDTPEYYAYYAFRQWGHFMKTTMLAGKGAGYNVGLDVSCRVAIANEIFNMMQSKYMSDDLFVTTLKYFHEMGEWMWGYWSKQEQGGNWGTSQVSGQYNLYSKFYEFRRAENWLNDPANPSAPSGTGAGPRSGINARLESQIEDLVQADGAYSECSLSYTKMTLNIYLSMKEVAEGANLGMPFSDNLISKVNELGRYMMMTVMPEYRDNQVGNTSSYLTNYKSVLYDVGELTNDPELLYAGSDGKEGYMTEERSKLYDAAKRAIMRTGWNKNDFYLHVNTDGGNHSHGHHDDLSVSIYAKGNYLIADPLYHSYTDNIYDKELVSVKGHNTIEVDNVDQKAGGWYLSGERTGGKRGNILGWESNEAYDFFTGQTVNYDEEGVFPQRSILFIKPGYWIVSDYLKPTDPAVEHDYNQRWHMIPEAGITMDDTTKTTRTNMDGSNIQVVPVSPEKYTSSEVLEGYYAGANRANYVMYTQHDVAGPAIFDTILYPEDPGAKLNITTEPIPMEIQNNDATAMTIDMTDEITGNTTHAAYYLVHNQAAVEERNVGSYLFDGGLFYHETKESGQNIQLFMQNGTKLVKDDVLLLQSEEPVENIAVRYSGNKIYIDGTGLTEEMLKKLIVRKNVTVSQVKLNGEAVSFGQTEHYVYFGDTPPADDPPPTSSAAPTKKPSDSGSHGGGGGGGNITTAKTPSPTIIPTPAVTQAPEQTAQPDGLTEVQRKELEGHWAKDELTQMIQEGLIQGDADSSLQLKRDVTRAEFAALLIRALEKDTEDTVIAAKYLDIPENAWYADSVYQASALGIVQGDGQYFRPEEPITREEMAVIAARVLQDKEIDKEDTPMFTDEQYISEWAKDDVKKAVSLGIIQGDENQRFAPKQHALREQAFIVIYRIRQQ